MAAADGIQQARPERDGTRASRIDQAWQIASGLVSGFAAAALLTELGVVAILKQSDMVFLAVGLMLGAALGAMKRATWMLGLVLPLLLVDLIVATTPLAGAMATGWVRNDSLPSRPVDAIVVPASGLTSDSLLEITATSRLLAGLELLRGGVAPRVVTTEVRIDAGRGPVSSLSDQRRLLRIANAESAWTSLPLVRTTAEEAETAARLLTPSGVRHIMVVTSPMHTRRACAAFERRGFTVVCRAAAERDNNRWHPANSNDRLAAFSAWLYERAGWWYYRMKGRV